MSWRLLPPWLTILVGCAACYGAAEVPDASLLAHADDYVFGYYSHGWRGRNAQGEIVFAVQTPNYALLMNASKARIERSGTVRSGTDAAVAVRQDNQSVLDRLSATPLTFQVRAGGIVYDAVAAAPAPDAVLIQRLGKYLAHVEVRGVTLRAPDAPLLEGANASIHLYAWPDHARVTFQLDSAVGLDDVTLTARYAARAGRKALRAVNLVSEVQRDRIDGNTTIVEHTVPAIAAGAGASLTVGLSPRAAAPAGGGDACVIRATGIAPYTGELAVFQDPVAGWRQVMLGENADIWTAERVRLELENPGDAARTVHLAFSKRGGGFGITGMSPVLCDEFGAPLGLPVQISKNWHVRPPWFDAVTMVDLAPRATRRIEFRLAYADWGGAPAVSHAQLALEGWGTHQLWDECAIGSFGESITYDPDVNLGRAMIDDVRPLMVWGMGAGPQRKWSWTHNVGGGDLLVLEQDGKRQYVVRQKTHYESQGPVLTNVQYAGETPDGAIQSHVTAQSWRSDDFVRGLYALRYDVTRPVSCTRLAFFQLGADRYNTNLFASISRGAVAGHDETWTPPMGGKAYSRSRLPLSGDKPWLAITGNTKNPPTTIKDDDQGAWADRGLIVHRWSARLGGVDVSVPHYSVFGTDDGNVPSAIVELSPPPEIDRLHPGDYVDALVEMVILPQRADDYYGPNDAFRAALREHGGTWKMVQREAVGASLRVDAGAGEVVSSWPVVIRAQRGRRAAFTIGGGNGWVPIRIVGARAPAGAAFGEIQGGDRISAATLTQGPWWQTQYRPRTESYDLVYTVSLDAVADGERTRAFSWTESP